MAKKRIPPKLKPRILEPDEPVPNAFQWAKDEKGLSQEATEGIAQCVRIREVIEELDVDHDFLRDVYDRVADVAETIERINKVTEKQQAALDNWEAAVGKFHKRRD